MVALTWFFIQIQFQVLGRKHFTNISNKPSIEREIPGYSQQGDGLS